MADHLLALSGWLWSIYHHGECNVIAKHVAIVMNVLFLENPQMLSLLRHVNDVNLLLLVNTSKIKNQKSVALC